MERSQSKYERERKNEIYFYIGDGENKFSEKQIITGVRMFVTQISLTFYRLEYRLTSERLLQAIPKIKKYFYFNISEIRKLGDFSDLYEGVSIFINKNEEKVLSSLKMELGAELPSKEKIPTYLDALSILTKDAVGFYFIIFEQKIKEKWMQGIERKRRGESELKSQPSPFSLKTKTLS